ncbi:MAG TPA: hypothetical protein VMT89_03800 [Candidatus Acidoferrales bacterium]|nr:hypothetical protein [Candidatus Acidoferrales bacterium]
MIRKVYWIFAAVLMMLPLQTHATPSATLPDPQCAQQCRAQLRTCNDGARQDFRMCAASTCSDEADAAKAACDGAPFSAACQQARGALRQCLSPCFDDLRKAWRTCRSDAVTCVGQCPQVTPTPRPGSKDPQCVASCRVTYGSCSADARNAAITCAGQCQDLVKATRQACTGGPSDACAAALKAANACLQPCGDTLRQAIGACLSASQDCIGACPDRTPATSSTTPFPPRR